MKRKLLYVIDNVNYRSGVQKVTAFQARCLGADYDISVFTLEPPDDFALSLFPGVSFVSNDNTGDLEPLTVPFFKVMLSGKYSLRQKAIKFFFSLTARFQRHDAFLKRLTKKNLDTMLDGFDTICVVSEGSKLREAVAARKKPKKVQWIHTDYALWSDYSDWTRALTQKDGELYRQYDAVVCLSQAIKAGFISRYPHLEERTLVIRNLITVEEILGKADEPCLLSLSRSEPNLITVGRIDREKAFDRTLPVCRRLRDEGFRFVWHIVGDGVLSKETQQQINELSLTDCVFMAGAMDNPYPALRQCDLFLLLSRYEGLPVTIDEALILGTPVIATDIGGIKEQIEDNITGYLVYNNEEEIYRKLRYVLETKAYLALEKKGVDDYRAMNRSILHDLQKLF